VTFLGDQPRPRGDFTGDQFGGNLNLSDQDGPEEPEPKLKETIMKLIIATSTILALLAGTASIASAEVHERPDLQVAPVFTQPTAEVAANALIDTKDRARWNLKPGDKMIITVYPSKGYVKPKGGDN